MWLDGDGDGRRSSAYAYADALVREADGDLQGVLDGLAAYDASVAAQAAPLLERSGWSLSDPDVRAVWEQAAPAVGAGFAAYLGAGMPSDGSH
jgi:hypothetical protein